MGFSRNTRRMAKLTDADGAELVRLINELLDTVHGSFITDLHIHYRTQFVGEPDPHRADQGWSVRMAIGGSDTTTTAAMPTLVDALQLTVTQRAEARQRDRDASTRPKKRKR